MATKPTLFLTPVPLRKFALTALKTHEEPWDQSWMMLTIPLPLRRGQRERLWRLYGLTPGDPLVRAFLRARRGRALGPRIRRGSTQHTLPGFASVDSGSRGRWSLQPFMI